MHKLVLLIFVLVSQFASAQTSGNLEAGKAAFKKCASCHQVGPSARGGFGPELNGIIGRRAGATGDYRYSQAMKNSGIVWSEKSLTAFLKDPSDLVPGTKMRFYGIGDEKEITNLLTYLRSFPMVNAKPVQ
ncbi:cytochrome c family protein [Undibacterium sp. RTI2.1]|uniref:c-type cytochrome n=1 Tax=unclassified Undibacterium TaxID=2630295 RepID=UPI002AB5CFB5|nr:MULTISPECIES: cytochrome c family protein [unclassified Undibacterium]MDY7540366.1 cytochrome c family protein [Undibacterium sp. 5I1]MEB0029974.1 cytochrome c family protein [Undibacterium sp. RTI2.1]MEB0117062.1 cytochrome c family protein [Undibacterium sp. RTI2.2]MEB0229998.1 cytochrome c family protein [Undibacterium sp. 10I3]MEB0258018.1 cytochrome c family protein [Undibacterium sp. 5I1]